MEQAFYSRDGKVAKSLEDLSSILRDMTDDEFSHHVNEYKNDFANWVEHVLSDGDLAAKLKQCRSKQDLFLAVDEALMRQQVSQQVHEREPKPDASVSRSEPEGSPQASVVKETGEHPEKKDTAVKDSKPDEPAAITENELKAPEPPEADNTDQVNRGGNGIQNPSTPPPKIEDPNQRLKDLEKEHEKKDLADQPGASADDSTVHGSDADKHGVDNSDAVNSVSARDGVDNSDAVKSEGVKADAGLRDNEDKQEGKNPENRKIIGSESRPGKTTIDDKKGNPKYFSVKEFVLGLVLAFLLGIALTMVVTKLFGV